MPDSFSFPNSILGSLATGGTTAWEHGNSAESVGTGTIPPGASNRWKPVMFGGWNGGGWTNVGWWDRITGNIVVNFHRGANPPEGANWVPAGFN